MAKGIENRRPNVKKEICDSITEGDSFKGAALSNGITEATFYSWLRKDKDFEKAVNAALVAQNLKIKSEARKSLLTLVQTFEYDEVKTESEIIQDNDGKPKEEVKKVIKTKKIVLPNSQAVQFALTNLEPNTFANKQDLTSGGKPLEGSDGFFNIMKLALRDTGDEKPE